MKKYKTILIAFVVLSSSGLLRAEEKRAIGYISFLEGQAQIFSDPRESLEGTDEPRALYENYYWVNRSAQIKMPLYLQDYIVCYQGCRLKATFYNSYTLILGSGSKLRLGPKFLRRSVKFPRFIDLVMGSLRAMILKKENRKEPLPMFRTKSSVMGVRGTDFVITTDQVKTVVSVITGEIGLRSAVPALFNQEKVVSSGMSSQVFAPSKEELRKSGQLTQQELQKFLPVAPQKIAPARIKKIQNLTGNTIAKDPHLDKLAESINPKKNPKKDLKKTDSELLIPTLVGGGGLSMRTGEIEAGPDLDGLEEFRMQSIDLGVEFLPFSWPVSLGFSLSVAEVSDGRSHWDDEGYSVHELKGWEVGLSLGYWFTLNPVYLALKFKFVPFSRMVADGTHYQEFDEHSHRESRNYKIPGGGLRLGVIYPFTESFAGSFEIGPSEHQIQWDQSEKDTHRRFHIFHWSFGVLFQTDSFFSNKALQ